MSEENDLDAGDFASWATATQAAIRGEQAAEVPCGGCTACCTSSQFVHIGPDEATTLAHIPGELLFPAPGLPSGHVVLGYDERGHCPMLVDNMCSIYEHRPRTCRTYDCRVFPASGLSPDDADKSEIARRARRWRFRFPTVADEQRLEAVSAAASFIRDQPDLLAGDAAVTPTQHAVLALELHEHFLQPDEKSGRTVITDPEPQVIRDAISTSRYRDRRPLEAPDRRHNPNR